MIRPLTRVQILRAVLRRMTRRIDRPGYYAERSPYHARLQSRLARRYAVYAAEYAELTGAVTPSE